MELLFLGLLFAIMVAALTSGFPVAFSLPGAAIITILLAAGSGYLFEGNIDAYFANDGPKQWLSAGVTNFRSLYWIVERDTLIAIPLFIFMGIMLQRSKIAEDLLLSMAQLFGPVPGGLGVSVVFVGALLAATTGIVGATVIAMGMISLPAMLRNNYSKSLACGTICASGTLGQIIPPSIVLIILADQLSSAADQANTMRKTLYRTTTGEYGMPSQFDVISASAGDMFMGAFIPGLILVGLYMAYILIVAFFKPEMAPPVPFEGKRDSAFVRRILMALIPPLALIFMVLGSIVSGIATVNQAGSIGAIGAMIMAGYRLHEGKKGAYIPAIIALAATASILYFASQYNLNIKSATTERDEFGIMMAIISVVFLLIAIGWSAWRAYKVDNTLNGVMIETVKTTSMVFIILIGAAMLTSAFRAFGGEEIVKHFLVGLPGGFWTQFLVVMLVIFLLGFFLDFIEIAVVVVPIVAPILLANPEANITAVWFGVMIGLNMQTSFLTPPFGFALFYLRGVADKIIKTIDIYKGASAFIGLQLLGLAIAGFYPSLVNYLPLKMHLTSETAPPPVNPKLQMCLEGYVSESFSGQADTFNATLKAAQSMDLSSLTPKTAKALQTSFTQIATGPALLDALNAAKAEVDAYIPEFRPVHSQTRAIESDIRNTQSALLALEDKLKGLGDAAQSNAINAQISSLQRQESSLRDSIPDTWGAMSGEFKLRNDALKKARRDYQSTLDGAFNQISDLQNVLASTASAEDLSAPLAALSEGVHSGDPAETMFQIKALEKQMSDVPGVSKIKTLLSKARRALKKGEAKRDKAIASYTKATELFAANLTWRTASKDSLLPQLSRFKADLSDHIGLRAQDKLSVDQAKYVASCQANHRDISIYF
ncbi:MAG: TRAP transporter large permease subunit [Arenicellales bacterium]